MWTKECIFKNKLFNNCWYAIHIQGLAIKHSGNCFFIWFFCGKFPQSLNGFRIGEIFGFSFRHSKINFIYTSNMLVFHVYFLLINHRDLRGPGGICGWTLAQVKHIPRSSLFWFVGIITLIYTLIALCNNIKFLN